MSCETLHLIPVDSGIDAEPWRPVIHRGFRVTYAPKGVMLNTLATCCWIWKGERSAHGYGLYGGKFAHRFVYEWLVGPVPKGIHLDHRCRQRGCVNPGHLEPVTPKENARRRVRYWRGREICTWRQP